MNVTLPEKVNDCIYNAINNNATNEMKVYSLIFIKLLLLELHESIRF